MALYLAGHRGPEQRPLGLGQHEAEDAAAEAVVRQREVGVVEDEHVVRGAAWTMSSIFIKLVNS